MSPTGYLDFLNSEEEIYSGDWDNYYSARIIAFTADVVIFYINDEGADYFYEENDYQEKNSKIVAAGIV
ncbi:MAG TPA: hypothetical protein ENN20_06420 [Candidatus Marinimicrobia bacterium]|nr:hypothetical protein [Candidatus Neomarinimicrobiota bacterium]